MAQLFSEEFRRIEARRRDRRGAVPEIEAVNDVREGQRAAGAGHDALRTKLTTITAENDPN